MYALKYVCRRACANCENATRGRGRYLRQATPQKGVVRDNKMEQNVDSATVSDGSTLSPDTERADEVGAVAQTDDHSSAVHCQEGGESVRGSKLSRIIEKAKSKMMGVREETADKEKVVLKKAITPLSGIGIVVGNLIGSGIFITPSTILCLTGSFGLSLICWTAGALVALAGALCYFELGMIVKKTGGDYAILMEAYSFRKKNPWVTMLGSLIAFLFTWTSVVVLRGASASIITLACARYLTRPFFIGCEVPENVVKLLALAILSKRV